MLAEIVFVYVLSFYLSFTNPLFLFILYKEKPTIKIKRESQIRRVRNYLTGIESYFQTKDEVKKRFATERTDLDYGLHWHCIALAYELIQYFR